MDENEKEQWLWWDWWTTTHLALNNNETNI